jgi:transposase
MEKMSKPILIVMEKCSRLVELHTLIRDTLITYRGSYDINKIEAASAVGVQSNQIYNWKKRIADETSGIRLTGEEREELLRLRKEVKKLKIEKEILKKASAYFAKEMK